MLFIKYRSYEIQIDGRGTTSEPIYVTKFLKQDR